MVVLKDKLNLIPDREVIQGQFLLNIIELVSNKHKIDINNLTQNLTLKQNYKELFKHVNNQCKKEEKKEVKKKEVKKKNNNETIGMSAENAVCEYFNIEFNSGMHRVNKSETDKIKKVLEKENINKKINITKHIGNMNSSEDFITICSETVSLKINQRNEGKICPQKGQTTFKSWDKKWEKDWNGSLEKNKDRFNFIKENISLYLNYMLKQTFCCDYLLHITNCAITPKVNFIKKPDLDYFKEQNIIFTRDRYEERYNSVKKSTSEFSTNIKMKINNKIVNIGEFQFHFKSRKVLKFRFYYKFLKLIC